MDTLELLENIGTVEAPHPVVLERVGADLLAVLSAETARRSDTPRRRAALAIVPSRVEKQDAPERVPGNGHGGGHRRRRWPARVAAVVIVAGTAGGVSMVVRPGSPGGPTPAAAAVVLKHLADVAAAQPAADVPAPGQYLYVDSENAYTSTTFGPSSDGNGNGSYTVLLPQHRQIWIGPDGSGRLFETYGQPSFLSAADHADWVAAGSPAIPTSPGDSSFGPGGLSFQNLSTLPTDPSALAALIASRKVEGGPPGSAEDFTQIGDLLRETDASPALRSALYQVAAGLPGVEVLGTVADHAGRSGIGLAEVNHGDEHELIFDPTTSALIGEQDKVVGPGSDEPVGTVVGWATYLQSTVVDSTTSTGPGNPAVPLSPSDGRAGQAVQ
ncbi:MAG TPA: CU044_5270 family protein [Acidimicrobiales bacterium]